MGSTPEQLRAIQPGWHEGNQGSAIVPELIDMCEALLHKFRAHNMELPALYPVQDGSIDIIWETLGVWCTLEAADDTLVIVKKPVGRPAAWDEIQVTDFDLTQVDDARVDFVWDTLMQFLSTSPACEPNQ